MCSLYHLIFLKFIYFHDIFYSSFEQEETPSACLYADKDFIELRNERKSLDLLNTNISLAVKIFGLLKAKYYMMR